MSNSVDTRIVEMRFDNAQFERGISSTLKSLENLKKGLKLEGATSGLDHLATSASKFNIGNIASGVQTVASRFSTMGIVGVTALASIATQAIATGAAMIKNLTVAPLQAGLQEYETNLNSIQTILANTGLEGKAGLGQVTSALNELNTYSDKTIYNFSEMARNIGTFTAAGIDLKTSTAAIKGIANLAAISGSTSEQASTAMYQLSQAMAAGKATLVDWNSVVNAGMGGKVFQEALKETARVQGVNIDSIIKSNGSFRDSLQEGWLTTEVLTATLQKFTGDMNAQQLKSLGYTDAQIKAILKMGKTAQDAATKVKTVSQLIGTLQEAAGSGWSQTFQLLFGDFDEARTLFTNVSNVLGGFIQQSAQARNKVIGDWKALGGRTVLIEAIAIAFNDLMDVLTPIKKAFRDIFPPATGKQLFGLTVGLRNLFAAMRLNEGTMDNIRRTARGLFAIFDIGIQVLKGIGTTIKTVFQSFKGGSGGILDFTGNIGDWLVALDKAIKSGKGFTEFFVDLGNVIRVPIEGLKVVIQFIKDFVSGIDNIDFKGLDGVGARFAQLGRVGGAISKVWSGIVKLLKKVIPLFKPIVDIFSKFFEGLGEQISSAFDSGEYSNILDSINTGLLGGIALLIAKFLKGGINLDVGGGVFSSIKKSFEGLTGVLSGMQTQLKANSLIKIAGAVALLTVSVVALSLIDSGRLTSALTAMTVMFTQLLGAMAIFEKITATKGFLKMPFLTAGLIALAIAIDVLVIAVSKLSKLDWPSLVKGLTGVAALLGALALFTKFGDLNASGIRAGAGIVLLAVGINILVRAVTDLAGLSWGEIAKGLVGVAALLGALALFTQFSTVNAGGIAQGAGLVLLATGIKILASAMEDLGKLSWGQIAKGLVAMAGGLTFMAIALALVPPSSVLSAAAIFVTAESLGLIAKALAQMGGMSVVQIAKSLIVLAASLAIIAAALYLMTAALPGAAALIVAAGALMILAPALQAFGGMKWSEIAKGLTVLAASLLIIAAATTAMILALPGAAALVVVAAALRILAPVLLTFGGMKWSEIAKGLVMLAGVFVVLAAAGILLTPMVPTLLGLGVAITLMGIGMLAAGGGMLLFATGLTAVAVSGGAAVGVLVGAVRAILNLLPEIVTKLGDFVVAFARAVERAAPAVVKAIVTVLLSLLAAIDKLAPRIIATLGRMLELMLQAMIKYIPKMADAGLKILIGILTAIANNIGKVVTAGTNIVVNFLKGIQQNLPRVIQEGANTIISFINGVANGIRNNSSALGAAGGNLATAIIEGMVRGIAGGIGSVVSAAKNMAKSALQAAKDALLSKSPSKRFMWLGEDSSDGMAIGLENHAVVVAKAAAGVGEEAITALQKSMSGISDVLTTDANFNPVIRPVLDLTDVKKDAVQIGSMLATAPIQTTTTSAKAKDASSGYAANQIAQQQIEINKAATVFEYTQVNNSPKALSSAEIYRQTNNQLSTVKGALKK